jgi:type VI protein secretion system component Hcp
MADTFTVLELEGLQGESQRFDDHLDVLHHCRASSELLNRVAHGDKVFDKGAIKVYTGNAENPFLKKTYEMKQIVVSHYQEHGDTVSFTLSPTEIKWVYTEQNDDGTAGSKYEGGFNRKTLKPA